MLKEMCKKSGQEIKDFSSFLSETCAFVGFLLVPLSHNSQPAMIALQAYNKDQIEDLVYSQLINFCINGWPCIKHTCSGLPCMVHPKNSQGPRWLGLVLRPPSRATVA